jgi:hypothetical protein
MERIETTIGDKGRLLIENLPFKPSQQVEVFVVSKPTPGAAPPTDLLGSVLEYIDPFEPVAAEDWESAR